MVREEEDFDPFSDDDPLSYEERSQPQKASASKALRVSLFIVGGALLAILLTAIAANNATPSSSQERLALGINQAARVVLLFGFVGVLVAYRLTQIKQLFERIPLPSSGNPELTGDGFAKPAIKRERSGLLSLTVTTVVGLLVLWGLTFALAEAFGTTTSLLLESFQLIFIAIVVTLGVYSRGVLRGFAIGSISAIVASRFDSISGLQSIAGFYTYSYSQPNEINRTLLTYALAKLTVACFAGLICAGLVMLIERKATNGQTKSDLESLP